MPRTRNPAPLAALLLLALYCATGVLGLSLAQVNASATAVWAPTGIAIGALLIWGRSLWPLVFVGAFVVNMLTSGAFATSLMIATGNTLEALVGAALVERHAGGRHAFARVRDIVRFVLLAAAIATAISASTGVSALLLTGRAEWHEAGAIWLTWWLGDAVGALLVTPVILLWSRDSQRVPARGRLAEALVLTLIVAVLAQCIFGTWPVAGDALARVKFLMLPPVIWAAVRFGTREVASLVLLICVIAVWGTSHGAQPFADVSPNMSLLLLQCYLAVVALSGYLLATALAERDRGVTELRANEEQYRLVAEAASDAIIAIDADDRIVYANRAVDKLLGHAPADLLGTPLAALLPEAPWPARPAALRAFLATDGQYQAGEAIELRARHRDGSLLVLEVALGEYRSQQREVIVGFMRDITERKRAEEEIRYLSQHDMLTGLPNRALCGDRIEQALMQADRAGQQVAILFLDLDGFKHVNDSLGHHVGDQLLQVVAVRLQRCLREGDSVARLGGDEFLICLPGIGASTDAMPIAEKVLASFREHFRIDGHDLHLGGSIGISVYPADGLDAESLMRAADAAMYHAKEMGRNHYRFYTSRLNETAQRRLRVANRLHQALARGELHLAYQPQVELASGRIVAAEVLVRWNQPELGAVQPAEFIRVAEDTGLIVPIGAWVLQQACRQLQAWREEGVDALRIAVNLSPQQLRREGFAELVRNILAETALPPEVLELEVTESVMMQGAEFVAALEQLAGLGVRLTVDDFGTGYASLSYLQRFPMEAVKIDRCFVQRFGIDRSNTAIVKAIIAMARSLDLQVTAEGVESAEQALLLLNCGCHAAQGYYCKEALGATEFLEFLVSHAGGEEPDMQSRAG